MWMCSVFSKIFRQFEFRMCVASPNDRVTYDEIYTRIVKRGFASPAGVKDLNFQ
jgi:hypothetical protein